MTIDYRDLPIVREFLPHTGHLSGDDTGYRNVEVTPHDAVDPDPLVDLDGLVRVYPVYAEGRRPGITPYYGAGIGGAARLLLREPAARALVRVDQILARYDRKLLVLDAFRSASTQAALWKEVFLRLIAGANRDAGQLSVLDVVTWGRRADDTASFCAVADNEAFVRALADLSARPRWAEVESAAAALGADRDALAREYLVFEVNRGNTSLSLDKSAPTAHGGGGAADVFLLDRSGQLANLGVPFDSTNSCAVIDFFEWSDLAYYQDLVARDAGLQTHLAELGVNPGRVTETEFAGIRAERRLLFHAMREVGATFFSLGRECGEPWHFNLSNEDGGKQVADLPGAGNSCQSLLRDVRDRSTGRWTAAWGNATAHALAAAWNSPDRRTGSRP